MAEEHGGGVSPPAAFNDSFACSFHEPVSVIFRY